jgi:AcrR family transcriptional regulator
MTSAYPDIRTAVIETALRLFIDRGFHGTPTSEIAKQSGVATGTLFYHFDSKELLISSIYIHVQSHWTDYVTSGADPTLSIKAQCHFLFTNMIDWAVEFPEYFRFRLMVRHSPLIDKVTEAQGMEAIKFTREMISSGQDQGVFRPGEPDLIFESSASIMQATVFSILSHGHNPDQMKIEGFDLFWSILACPLSKTN